MNASCISYDKACEWLKKLEQHSLLNHLHGASAQALASLKAQLCALDWGALEKLLASQTAPEAANTGELSAIQPYVSAQPSLDRAKGVEVIKKGQLALFTVAGGQGSRLGYEGPKGCFGVTPVQKKSLFEVFAGKILAAERRYGITLPWVLMTSPQNNTATEGFFKENQYFGLKPQQLYFFEQGMLPAVDAITGQFLLEGEASLALSPDGHGGSIKGLYRSGVLALLKKQGIRYLSYFQVDNPLVKVVDPLFLGAHLTSGSQFSSKSVVKRNAEEKVGVLAYKNNQLTIVEYSDMPPALTKATTADGSLVYAEGNVAIHLLDIDFIDKIAQTAALPYHKAIKKIAYWQQGKTVQPDKPNAVKFEQFIFDALPLAQQPMVMRTQRAEEFSPVKNAEGADSPQTCTQDQLKLWVSWFKAVGIDVPTDSAGVPLIKFEIAPTYADSLETFITRKDIPTTLYEGMILA